jgi:F-type H+-transporting ATPase subunit b
VQFAVLAGIIWGVGFGFGQRRGMVTNMLAERHATVGDNVEEALASEKVLADAKREAGEKERAARAEARRIITEAKRDAEKTVETARGDAEAEAALVTKRAENALVTEREEMQLELRDRLVEAVATATRAIMDEQMTVSEQRTLIESAIAASVEPNGQDKAVHAGEAVRA